MTDPAPTLPLFSAGLLSKWGFGDGDEPDAWLDWCDEQGIDYGSLRPWRDGILPELVRRYLAPALDQKVELTVISTNHNPVRAETVDGIDVTDGWYGGGAGPDLTPEWVEVTMEQVLEVAREQP